MADYRNDLGQPIGFPVPTWTERRKPPRAPMEGSRALLEPLEPRRHAGALFEAFSLDRDGRNWTYMSYGPFVTAAALSGWMQLNCLNADPQFYAIIDRKTGKAVGMASFLRMDPKGGSIEVGHIHFSPLAQRTALATEAMFLMASRAFDELAYRRYEWKCDCLNEPSRRAADRLGFTYEGISRRATVYKGRNRDTAWYAMTDEEWPALRDAYRNWLDPSNFDGEGGQKQSLTELTAAALASVRPAAADDAVTS